MPCGRTLASLKGVDLRIVIVFIPAAPWTFHNGDHPLGIGVNARQHVQTFIHRRLANVLFLGGNL